MDRGGELLGIGRLDRSFATGAESLSRFRVLVVLAILVSVAMGFSFSIITMIPGLSPSYVYSYNYAAAHGLAWGRDFISTYGPYGYLTATMDLGNLVEKRIIFAFALAVGVGIAAAAYARSVPGLGPGAQGAMMLALIYAFSVQDPEYQWFVFFLLLFLTGLTPGRAGLVAYGLAGLLAGFCALIKLSLGTGALLTLLFGSVLTRHPVTAAWRLGVGVPGTIVGFLIGWHMAGGNLSGIPAYLSTGWEVSNGYSSAMSYFRDTWWIEIGSLLLWLTLIVVWVVVRPGLRSRLTLAGLGVPLFIAWKHSIVRQDEHVVILARFGVFVMAVLAAEALPAWRPRITLSIAGLLLVPLTVPLITTSRYQFAAVTAEEMVLSPVAFRGLRNLVRLGVLSIYRESVARESRAAVQWHSLPESTRQLIGQTGVDVYPWDISYLTASHLVWSNRPLSASFNGYTPVLDGLNAAFFESSHRPQYVLWHAGFAEGVRSIDGRHLFWDEPQTLRAIFSNYDAVAAVPPQVLLLRSRAHPRFGSPRPLATVRVPWDDWIEVPITPGVLLAAPRVERSLPLRLIRMAFREDPMLVAVRFSSGERATYRVVPDNMRGGLWLNPFAATYDELPALLNQGTGRRVVAIRFLTMDWSMGWLVSELAPTISLTWYQLLPPGAPDPASDRPG